MNVASYSLAFMKGKLVKLNKMLRICPSFPTNISCGFSSIKMVISINLHYGSLVGRCDCSVVVYFFLCYVMMVTLPHITHHIFWDLQTNETLALY